MATYRLTLEYDGSDFHGWQIQPRVRTVEGELRAAVIRVSGENPVITAAGRTDAGAHAHGQVVGLSLHREWRPEGLRDALNAVLPVDVAVAGVVPAPAAFHARHDALRRTYRYLILPRDRRSPISRRRAWQVRGPLDLKAMRRAAETVRGRHDFAAFGRSPRKNGSTVRTVFDIDLRRTADLGGPDDSGGVIIDVTADAFLHGMMRGIAGSLVAVGQGRLGVEEVAGAVSGPSGMAQKTVAPAHGLHQWTVTYPDPQGGVSAITSERN